MESRGVAKLMFIAGIIFIILSFFYGEAKAGIFVIFPFIYGNGIFLLAGILLIFLSMILFAFSLPIDLPIDKEGIEKVETKKGGILLIGPIPIIISDDTKITFAFVIIAIFFLLLFLLFLFIKI